MILVTGATGSIGRPLVHQLRQDGAAVRALVRDEAKGREFLVGDFDDPASIVAALAGVDRLFLNGAGAQPADGEQPMVRQQKSIIDAAVAAGVERVVKVSVWQAREGERLAGGAHWQIEQHLKASGLGWSILQPNGFMQNFITGQGSFTADGNLVGAYGDAAVSYIDCADIAACAAALLTGRAGDGETFLLSGPEALTYAQIAEKLSVALGRTVRYVNLTVDELIAALTAQGLPPQFAEDVAVLTQGLAGGIAAPTTTAVRDLTGHSPRTFDEFLAAHHGALTALASASRR